MRGRSTTASGRLSRASPVQTAMRNRTRDEGRPFGFGDQEPIPSHRKLLRSKAVVVSVAGTPGQDSGRHGRERRAQATAKSQDNISSPHSITSSARNRNDSDMTRPRALAVLRLMISSYLVGCSTGSSLGRAPLRILSASAALR